MKVVTQLQTLHITMRQFIKFLTQGLHMLFSTESMEQKLVLLQFQKNGQNGKKTLLANLQSENALTKLIHISQL